jgi:hypothetical protein
MDRRCAACWRAPYGLVAREDTRDGTMNLTRRSHLLWGLFLMASPLRAQQAKTPEITDLFSPPSVPRGSRGARSSALQIPGMRPETVGAVSVLPLSPAGTRSVRSSRETLAQQRLRIALPNRPSIVCALTSERRDSGVLVMHGMVEAKGNASSCSLYEEEGKITGTIDLETGRYAIVPLGSDLHAIVEVKSQAFPSERPMSKSIEKE